MKRYLVTILAIAAALALLAGCSGSGSSSNSSSSGDTFKQVSAEEAIEMMESESDYIILDVRTKMEYASGHIPGAINIPVEDIGSDEIAELPDKDQLIFVYCRSGNRSKTASGQLVVNGYSNIVEFGGINDWPGEVVTD